MSFPPVRTPEPAREYRVWDASNSRMQNAWRAPAARMQPEEKLNLTLLTGSWVMRAPTPNLKGRVEGENPVTRKTRVPHVCRNDLLDGKTLISLKEECQCFFMQRDDFFKAGFFSPL